MSKFATALTQLGEWFEHGSRVLPWREDPSWYRVWISEIMLQQTQVATVVPYFERWMGRFESVEALAAADEDEVMRHWAGLGYYSRARNVHRAARQIVAARGFPTTREGWLDLPGVGPYTAGAILSIAGNRAEPILDGNVERVMSRVRRVNRKSEVAYKARLWRLARIWVERGAGYRSGRVKKRVDPRVLNQALMELGATVCSPRKPACGKCPLQGVCRGFAVGDAEAYPPRKAPKQWIAVRESRVGVVAPDGRVLVRRAGAGEWRAGLWDLPEEAPKALLRRGRALGSFETRHVVTRHKITRTVTVWGAAEPGIPKVATSPGEVGEEWRWVRLDGELEVATGSAFAKCAAKLREIADG